MREAILNLLKSQEEISGQFISEQLQISRAAVAKHIQILRKEGYQIQASTKKGYRLLALADVLTPAEITPFLQDKSLWQLQYCGELPSTNTLLRQMAEQGAADHTILLAEQQTAGQGRLDRSWYSESHMGLLCSLLLRPPLSPTVARAITLTAAVAICAALRQLAVDAYIKWPNDILSSSGKKLCGIKSEMRCDMDSVQWLLVGFGLNINNQQFPPELQAIAGSLATETGKHFCRAEVAATCFNSFEQHYRLFLEQGFGALRPLWLKQAVSIGKQVKISSPGGILLTGIARDIDEDGCLLLECAGQLKTINCGDMLL